MKYSVNPAIRELERAYQFFNGELFGGGLDSNVVITIQSRGRKSALGWHWAGKWKNGDTAEIAEINLSAEELKTGDPYEVLIHEMTHHLNHQKGIQDVSRGQYHNKRFKEAAEAAGLVVKKAGNVGFGITELGERAKEAVLKCTPQKEVFALLRRREIAASQPKRRKWTCGCGFNVMVARRDFDATCNLCATRFELKGDS